MDLKTTRWDVGTGSDAGIATITLSRPERRNSWTGRMHTELRHLLQIAEDHPDVRAVIITGDPEGQTFCPGPTARRSRAMSNGAATTPAPRRHRHPRPWRRSGLRRRLRRLFGLDVVTIAAVNGAAAGVGLALACWCDLRVAVSGATWTTAHGKLNLPAEYGLSWLLPRLIGHGRASDLLLSSRRFTSDEAERMGLVTRLVDDHCHDAALDLARSLVTDVSPHSLRATKRQMAIDATHDDPGRSVRDAQARLEQMSTSRTTTKRSLPSSNGVRPAGTASAPGLSSQAAATQGALRGPTRRR